MQDRSEWLASFLRENQPEGYLFTHARFFPRYHFNDPESYSDQAAISVSCTQMADPKEQGRLVKAWSKALPGFNDLKEFYFLSRFPNDLLLPVSQIPHLQHLHIKWSGLKNIEALGRLASLQDLHIGSSPSICNPEVVLSLPKLRRLSFENIRVIYDLSWIAQMSQIQELHIDGGNWATQKVLSLEPLKSLVELEKFSFVGSSLKMKGSLMVLAEMPSLKAAWLSWNWPKGMLKQLVKVRPDLWVNGQRCEHWQEANDRIMDLS